MRGITLGVFSSQPTYDVDFQTNVLDVAQTMGYAIPPLEKRIILNRLMVDMKMIGFYQLQDTIANFALGITGFEQFRMIDWNLTGNIYTTEDNPIYTMNGVEGDGISAQVGTNFNPVTMGNNYALTNASRGAVVYKQPTTGTGILSVLDSNKMGTSNVTFQLNGNSSSRVNGGTVMSSTVNLFGDGFKLISREGNNMLVVFKDVRQERTSTSPSFQNSPQSLFVYTAGEDSFSDTGASCYFMGAAVSYEMSQSFRTIYNQFLSNVGLEPIA